TYLLAIAYVLLSFVMFGVGQIMTFNPNLLWTLEIFGYTLLPQDLAYPFVAGNPFFMVMDTLEVRRGGSTDLFTALGHYCLFHAIVIILFLAWAGWRLRAIALFQTFGSTRRILRRVLRPTTRTEKAPS